MKRRNWLIFPFLAFFFALTLIAVENGEASECYLMYVNWDCLKGEKPDLTWNKYKTSIYVAKHKDGTVDVFGFLWGTWSQYGKTILLSFPEGECNPLYFGAYNAGGFAICNNGSEPVPAGCWHWVKKPISKKTCSWMHEEGSFSTREEADPDEGVTTEGDDED